MELIVFDNEGHGFRDGKVKVKVLKDTEDFFNKYLAISKWPASQLYLKAL